MRRFAALLLAMLCFATAASGADVTVKSFSPQGEIQSKRPQITVVFNGAAVRKSQVNKVLRGDKIPLKFRPALNGTARWTSVSKLVFTPSQDLQPATRYDADFGPGGLKTPSGSLVAGPQSFTFHRPALAFERVSIIGTSARRALTLRLDFNTEVSPVRLRGFLEITDSNGNTVGYNIQGAAPSKQIIVRTNPVYGKTVKVLVEGGLLPDKGDLPQDGRLEKTLDIVTETMVTNAYASTNESGHGRIRVGLNNSIDLAKAKGFIELSPAHSFTLSSSYDGFFIEGNFAPRSRVTLTIRKGLTARDSTPMEEDFVKAFIFPDMDSAIRFPSAGMFLTPAEDPRIAIETTNVNTLNVSAWRLYNNNVPVAVLDADAWNGNFQRLARPLGSKKYNVGGMVNEIARRSLDLGALGCTDEGVYMIQASNADPDTWQSSTMLLCITDTALSARTYDNGLHVWATSISSAAPVEGASVKVYSASNQVLLSGTTDANGLAEFVLPEKWDENLRPDVIVAEKEGVVTFVKLKANQLTGRDIDVSGAPWNDAYDALWILPRNLYQPGETLEAQAVVRSAALQLPGEFPLAWSLSNRGIDLASGTMKLDGEGTGRISVPIPATAESGSYSLKLSVPGATSSLSERAVQIEEFRPPEVETKITAPKALYPGMEAKFGLNARYLFGGSGAGLHWELSYATVPEAYVSKNNPGYVFGFETAKDSGRSSGSIDEGELDENGTAEVLWTPDSELTASSIIRAHIRLNVMESSGRWTGSTVSVPIYPTKALIGVLPPSGNVRPRAETEIGLVAVTPDDSPMNLGKVNVEVSKVTERYVMISDGNGSRMTWQEEFSEPKRDSVMLDGKGKYVFTPEEEGIYRISFTHKQGRASLRIGVWENYSGSSSTGATMPDRVEIHSDKEAYPAGSTAKITLKSPFAGRAVVTAGSNRPLMIKAFDMTSNEAEVEIPVTEAMTPNGWVVVHVVRPEGAETKPPYRALGAMPLKIDLSAHKLNVALELPEKAEPGSLTAKISVTDADGKPADGKVSIALVDRGILLLSDEDNENPYDHFTRRRALNGQLCDIYDALLPLEARGTALLHPAGGESAQMARMKLMANGDMMSPVRACDYKPLSIWLPDVEVKNGTAEVALEIPEFTGALRAEAVAVAKTSLGRGTAEVKVARPVVISVTLPRFAAPDDEIMAALNITSEQGGQANVTVTPSESLSSISGQPSENLDKVALPAKKRIDLTESLPLMMALNTSDHGALTVDTAMDGKTYTAKTGLAVRPGWPLTSLTGGAAVGEGTTEFSVPDEWYPGTGDIEVSLSGAPVVDALSLLNTVNTWGWGIERLISRGWIVLDLPGLLSEDDADLVNPHENRIALNTVLAGITSYQLYDGSWSRWIGGGTDPWSSVAALHLLTAIKEAGVIDPAGLNAGYQWLRRYMASQIPVGEAKEELDARAYGCYVLALAQDAPLGWMNWLEERTGEMNNSGRSLLAAAYALAGDRKKAEALAGSESGSASDTLTFPEAGFRMLALDAMEPGGAPSRDLAARIAEELKKNEPFRRAGDAASMVMALSVFSRNVAAGPATAKLTDGEGNVVLLYDGQPVRWKGSKGGKMTLEVTGNGSLWYSWTAAGVPATPVEEFAKGVKVNRQFLDAATKEPVDMGNVAFGQRLIMKITAEVSSPVSELRLSALFPAAIEAETAGELVKSDGYTVRSDLRFDRLLLNISGKGKTFQWQMPCRATYRGNFSVPPLSVEALGNKGVGCLTGAAEMHVE
ncbi:MAG: alpha-2-macroglobulin family protein [Pyramidobacter sp.]|jgi:uncharacterized protein YfaS (alpha-2-macroglobulin family)